MRVPCDIEEVEIDNDEGRPVDGVKVICRRCDEEVESFGRSPSSVRRCFVLLKEGCPMGESNFYVREDGEDED